MRSGRLVRRPLEKLVLVHTISVITKIGSPAAQQQPAHVALLYKLSLNQQLVR